MTFLRPSPTAMRCSAVVMLAVGGWMTLPMASLPPQPPPPPSYQNPALLPLTGSSPAERPTNIGSVPAPHVSFDHGLQTLSRFMKQAFDM
eukprot:764091-Hanusia_phi.AAC.12